MAKLTAPNPALFDPDALEQIFAKGVTARDNTAGLASSWLLMQNAGREGDRDKYLGALNRTNEMDSALQRQEIAAKLREQGMKSATDLIKEGFLPTTLNAGGDLFSNQGEGDNYAKMLQMLTQSKINKNNQPAGGGTKESVTAQFSGPGYDDVNGEAARGPAIFTAKGPDPVKAAAAAEAAFKAWSATRKNPNATPEQRARADAQLKQMQQQRVIQPD